MRGGEGEGDWKMLERGRRVFAPAFGLGVHDVILMGSMSEFLIVSEALRKRFVMTNGRVGECGGAHGGRARMTCVAPLYGASLVTVEG